MIEGRGRRLFYLINLYLDVAISAIPAINKLILTGKGISSFPKNIKIALLKQSIIPLMNLIKLKVFLFIISIIAG
jgi:hypothetical protein